MTLGGFERVLAGGTALRVSPDGGPSPAILRQLREKPRNPAARTEGRRQAGGTLLASATVADGDVFRLELAPLRRPVSLSILAPAAGLLIILGGVLGALTLGPQLFSSDRASLLGGAVGAALAAAALVVAWPRFRPPHRLEPIFIEGRRIIFPRSVWREGVARLDLRDVLHLGVAPGLFGHLEILTDRKRYRIPLTAFRDRSQLADLDVAFSRAVRELEGGAEHLAANEARHRLGTELARRRPEAVLALAGVIVAVTLVQFWLTGIAPDAYTRASVALRLGANAPALAAEEPWRLLSAPFVHATLMHAYLDVVVLLTLGAAVERLLGTPRVIVVFLLSAMAGSIATTASGHADLAVGASGGIFGLLGAHAALHVAVRERLPPGFRQPGRWWLFLLAVASLVHLVVPGLDVWAHCAGLMTGLALGIGIAIYPGFSFSAPPGRRWRYTAGGLIAIFGVGLAFAVGAGLRPRSGHETEVERVLLALASQDGELITERAAVVLADAQAPDHLKRAADAWLSTADTEGDAPAKALLLRSERLEAQQNLALALELRWRALTRHGLHAFPALVEGLHASAERPFDILGASPSSVEVRRLTGDDEVELVIEPPLREANSLFLLVFDRTGRVQGLFEWPLTPGRRPLEVVRGPVPDPLREELDAGGRLEPALWAAPSLTDGPTLHRYAPTDWRRLGPATVKP